MRSSCDRRWDSHEGRLHTPHCCRRRHRDYIVCRWRRKDTRRCPSVSRRSARTARRNSTVLPRMDLSTLRTYTSQIADAAIWNVPLTTYYWVVGIWWVDGCGVRRSAAVCRSFTYLLTECKVRRRCPAAGKITVGLESDWPCVTD